MKNQRVFLCPVFLLLAAFSSALAQNQQVYVAVDDKITLRLNPPASAEITRLAWFHEDKLLGDWTGGEFSYFGTFKGRTTIDSTTGSLEIKNATKSDSGLYEVEVNNVIQVQSYDVRVIRKVLKPSIWISPVGCSPSSVQCTLLCEAKTDESEPVTYSWREDGDWKEGTNTLDIGKGIKTFTCRLWNPVSEETSEPIENPFFREPLIPENSGNVGLRVGLGVGVVVGVAAAAAAAGVVVAYWKRDPIMRGIHGLTGHGGGSNGQKEPDPESREQTPLTKSGEQHPPSDPNSDGPRPPSDPKEEP